MEIVVSQSCVIDLGMGGSRGGARSMTREGVQESVRERRNSEIQKDQRGRDGNSKTECLKNQRRL